MRLVVSVDFDETSSDCQHIVVAFFGWLEELGIPSSLETYHRTHDWALSVPGQDYNQLYVNFYRTGRAPMPRHMPGAHSALRGLINYIETHITSARDPITLDGMKSHIGDVLFPGFSFASMYGCAGGKKKAPRLIEINADYHIDDSMAELNDLARHAKRTKLIQFPYFSDHGCPVVEGIDFRPPACELVNQLPPHIVCRRAWREIKHYLLQAARQATAQVA